MSLYLENYEILKILKFNVEIISEGLEKLNETKDRRYVHGKYIFVEFRIIIKSFKKSYIPKKLILKKKQF